jgi:DUF4097 and DUF4098 domain-containing protein YvlB
MKSILKGSVLLVLLAGCDANPFSPDESRADASDPFSYEINASNHTGLRLVGVSGAITITAGAQAGAVVVSGERSVRSGSRADAEAHLQELDVRVEEVGDWIYVETVQPSDNQGRNYQVDYRITVPRDFDVRVRNVSGGLDLRGLAGNAFVDLVSGQIDARVTLPPNGTLEMATVSGTIDLDIPTDTSAQFSATVVSGNIDISNLQVQDPVSTRNSIRGTLAGGKGMISLRTTSGNIGVRGF